MCLQEEILQLISLQQEGGYWDFKRQWYTNKTDMLHDIICMSNNLHNRAAYIIIGIDEEKNYSVVDVSGDPNRKNTQKIVDFLKDKKFAGGIRPIVHVESVCCSGGTTTIPLQLNERADYYSYLGLTPQMMPTGEPGSGLTIFNGSVVQFQCAYVADPKACSTLALRAASGYRAPALRYIDKQQLYAEFLQETAIQALPEDALPLGWYTRSIRPYSLRLQDTFCYFISDVQGAGAQAAVENLLLSISQKQLECHIVCRGSTAPYDAQFRQYCSYEDVLSLMTYLRDLFKTRAAAKKEYAASHTEAECEAYLRTAFPPVIVLFEDYNAFCAMSYSPGTRVSYTDVWETLLKNGRGYGVTFLAVWNRALYQQNFQKQAVQLFLSYQTGVHLGGKLDAQRAIETGLSITEQARIRPPETGFALEGTRLSEVYLPRTAAPAEEL